jgi:hypothetical protein
MIVRFGRCEAGLQEGFRRVQADAAPLVDFEIGAAGVVAAVEIVDFRDAGLVGGFAERVEDLPGQALALDAPFAAAAVDGAAPPWWSSLALNMGSTVPAPGRIAAEVGPAVVIAGLAAHVDHAVDRRTAAQHLAARIDQRAPGQAGSASVLNSQSVRGLPMQYR